MKIVSLFGSTVILLLCISMCSCGNYGNVLKEKKDLKESGPKDEWMNVSPSLWLNTPSAVDSGILIAESDGEPQNGKIGRKKRIRGIFERWTFDEAMTGERPKNYAEITDDCKGSVEINYALTKDDWDDIERRKKYFRDLDGLIEKVGEKLLTDMGADFAKEERLNFIRALKAMAWKESGWTHYYRYKNRFFVVLGSSDVNELGDWGITQIARSGFKAKHLINRRFFELKGYCSIHSSLYYGFLEFYFNYLHARQKSCNLESFEKKLKGAYNGYFSGFSTCADTLSKDKKFSSLQKSAIEGFFENYSRKTWTKYF